MGKTEMMLQELIKSLQEGQPQSIVVGASREHCTYLFYKLCRMLDEAGEPYTLLKATPGVMLDEARVDFFSIHEIDCKRMGRRGAGEFWDHYAEWCYDRYVDQTNKECTGN